MAYIRRKIDIRAPVESVYDFLEEPGNSTAWLRNLVDVRNVTVPGAGTCYHWSWKMAGIRLKGEITNLDDIPNERIVVKSRGGIESLMSIRFESHDTVTTLDLDIDYKIPRPVLGKVGEKSLIMQNERDADAALMKLKERLES